MPWPDRRVGSASGLPPELRRAAQGRRRARQGGAWRYAPRHRTRRRAARAMVRARKAPVSQPRCSASPWPEICAGPAAPGLAGLTRCTAAKGTYKWILQSNADGCQLTGTAACAAPRRASFCLLRCTLRLLQARAAAALPSAWTPDPNWRAMLFAAAAAVLCCCTSPWNRAIGISNYASDLGGAMGIRTPDLLHAMRNPSVDPSPAGSNGEPPSCTNALVPSGTV